MKKAILSTVLIVLAIVSLISSIGGLSNIQGFLFLPGLMFTIAMLILIIMAADSRPEIIKGLKVLFAPDTNYDKNELKRIHIAYDMLMKGMILVIVIENAIALVSLLSRLGEPSAIGNIMALCLLAIFYGAIIILLMLIIKIKVKMKMLNS